MPAETQHGVATAKITLLFNCTRAAGVGLTHEIRTSSGAAFERAEDEVIKGGVGGCHQTVLAM